MPANPERETIIRFSPSEPHVAYLYSTEPAIWRRMAKAGLKPTRIDKALGGAHRGHFYTIPRRLVLLRAQVPKKRIILPKTGLGARSAKQGGAS